MPVTSKCSKCGNQFMTPDGSAAQLTCAICRRSASPPPKPAEQIKTEPPATPVATVTPPGGSKTVEWAKQNKAATAAIAFVAVCLVLVGCIGSAALVGVKLFRGASESILALATMQAADDQKAILAWLQKNLHDPDSLEIVEWGPRKTYVLATNQTHEKFGVGIITVRIRSKNALGAKVVGDVRFEIKDGRVIEAKNID